MSKATAHRTIAKEVELSHDDASNARQSTGAPCVKNELAKYKALRLPSTICKNRLLARE
jgi:hypothetical protein